MGNTSLPKNYLAEVAIVRGKKVLSGGFSDYTKTLPDSTKSNTNVKIMWLF